LKKSQFSDFARGRTASSEYLPAGRQVPQAFWIGSFVIFYE